MIWATLLGYTVFDHFPDILTIAGCVIIAVGGMISMSRGRKPRPKMGVNENATS